MSEGSFGLDSEDDADHADHADHEDEAHNAHDAEDEDRGYNSAISDHNGDVCTSDGLKRASSESVPQQVRRRAGLPLSNELSICSYPETEFDDEIIVDDTPVPPRPNKRRRIDEMTLNHDTNAQELSIDRQQLPRIALAPQQRLNDYTLNLCLSSICNPAHVSVIDSR